MVDHEPIKLTTLAACAGCAAKMGPAALHAALRAVPFASAPALLVGLQTSDDAAVYQLTPDLAVIQTIDFFTPIVDDPWTFGAIAATNAMSDVYAMGGEVRLALNVAALPEDLPAPAIAAIFAGAAHQVEAAGGVIAGGHTIIDPEPKFGLSVTGTIHPARVLTKAGARPGDRLVLTKPLGTGVIATAAKRGGATPAALDAAISSMLTLNRAAAEAARGVPGIHACTDITGFGLLGHLTEVTLKSQAGIRLLASAVPSLPNALEYIAAGFTSAGLRRNREYYPAQGTIRISERVPPALAALLFDPQTSGGLLFAVSPATHDTLRAACVRAGVTAWTIGEVTAEPGIVVD